jgi:hypothetical protein
MGWHFMRSTGAGYVVSRCIFRCAVTHVTENMSKKLKDKLHWAIYNISDSNLTLFLYYASNSKSFCFSKYLSTRGR